MKKEQREEDTTFIDYVGKLCKRLEQEIQEGRLLYVLEEINIMGVKSYDLMRCIKASETIGSSSLVLFSIKNGFL